MMNDEDELPCEHYDVTLSQAPVELDPRTAATAHTFTCEECSQSAILIDMVSI